MSLWMLWAIATGVLFGLAGHVLELVARASERPGRWVWIGVIAGSIGLQLRSVLGEPDEAGGASTSAAVGDQPVAWWSQVEVALGPASLDRVEPFLGFAWLAASCFLLAGLIGGFVRLHQRAARWPRLRIGEHEVLVSEGFGPALIGFTSPRIVVPRPVLDRHPSAVPTICQHEAEHRAEGDGWIFAAGALLIAVFPWNLALWWQLGRLRTAVEMDCDQRVLRSGVPRGDYARTLLALGQRETGWSAVPTFLHPPLERRLDMLVRGVRKKGPLVTIAGVCAGAALIIGACSATSPTLEVGAGEAEATEPAVPGLIPPEIQSVSLAAGPLILVDGEEVDGEASLGELDPELIESIEVIKGPAAARLYGDRAAAGIIRITLKAGPN